MASKETPQSVEDILKTTASLDADGKLKLIATKYEELLQLFRSHETSLSSSKREINVLTTEKNKQILARSRLEDVCRQLQKNNKTLKDENLLKLREEEEKRKQIAQEFQKTLNNVTTMMTDSNVQNTKLGEENRQMAQRLSTIYEEFKTRENEVDRISKQIDIERQLADARCAKAKTEFLIEKQTMLSENEALNIKVAQLTKDLIDSTNKSIGLERQVHDVTAQLNQYTGKYEEFESTITKSGKVFDHCKAELNRMSKQVKTLEREVVEWQTRYHKSVSSVYDLQVENNEKKHVISDITKKQNQLIKLCRQLQNERKAYMNALREIGKDPNDILVEKSADDPAIEELMKPVSPNLAAGDADETKLGAKHKPILKAKRGKHKGKRGREISFDSTPTVTAKEIQLAELRQELRRVQHLIQLQTEAANAAAATIPLPDTKLDDISLLETETEANADEASTPQKEGTVEDMFSQLSLEDKTDKTEGERLIISVDAADDSAQPSGNYDTQSVDEEKNIDSRSDIIVDEACCNQPEIIEYKTPVIVNEDQVASIGDSPIPAEGEEDTIDTTKAS